MSELCAATCCVNLISRTMNVTLIVVLTPVETFTVCTLMSATFFFFLHQVAFMSLIFNLLRQYVPTAHCLLMAAGFTAFTLHCAKSVPFYGEICCFAFFRARVRKSPAVLSSHSRG